jgi:chemotaxis protein CheD
VKPCTETARPAGALAPPPAAERVYLHPGQLFVSTDVQCVATVLGSCVAVCLWDDRAGGVNHFLLPEAPLGGGAGTRFAAGALQALLGRLIALGSRERDLRAKVFGGASVGLGVPDGPGSLGLRNVETARRLLQERGIPIAAEDTGGRYGRYLLFRTDGAAWVRSLR